MRIVIPGNAIAKKNSQRIIRLGRRYAIRPSKAYDKWEKSTLEYLSYIARVKPWTGAYPVKLMIFFYRRNRAKFDLSNMIEGAQDVLQKAGVIDDDSMNHIIPVIEERGENYGWAVDRQNPRIEIKLTSVK